MKKKIAIPVIILVGIIVIGLSALWQNGYLDMNTPVVYKYSDNCVFDGNFYYSVSDENEVCIEGIRRIADTVEIPETIDGKPVVELGYDMINESQAKRLENIIVPDTVKIINNDELLDSKWCNNHPDGVAYIGKIAYKYKGKAPENGVVEIKEGTKYIRKTAFGYALYSDDIKQIILPEGLVEIGYMAFYGCENLESITLPESLEVLRGEVFLGCKNLKEINFPDKYIKLSIENFEDTAWLKNQPEGLIYAGKSMIGYSGKTTEKIDLDVKEGTVEINAFDFGEFDALGYINVPASCKHIDVPDTVFDGFRVHADNKYFSTDEMGNLYNKDKTKFIRYAPSNKNTEFTIPETVTEIESYAFLLSNNLEKIIINRNLAVIGYESFQTGGSIREFVVEDGNSAFCAIDGNLYSKDKKQFICYASGKTDKSITVPDGVVTINDYGYTFSDCLYLEEIILPESVEEFDWVYNCPKLDYSGIKTDNKELWENIEIHQLDGLLPRD